MRARALRAAAVLLVAATLRPVDAAGQGFGVYEQGACVMGRAGTGVARACADGSAIYFNPANLVATPDVISVGGTLIAPRGGFTNDLTGIRGDLEENLHPVPNLYLVKGLPLRGSLDRLALGVGVFVPFGLTTEWPTTFEGRYLGYKSVIRAVYVQPTAAVRILGRVAVGAGLDLNFAHVQLRQRVDLSTQAAAPGVTFANLGIPSGTDFADADLSASATHAGLHVGASARLAEGLDVGIRYMSRQSVGFDDGTVRITQVPTGLVVPASLPGIPAGTPVDALLAPQFGAGGPLTAQSAATRIRLPDQLVFGIAYAPIERARLLADAQWSHWAVFDRVPITFEKLPAQTLRQDNRDVWDLRFGAEYDVSRSVTLRGGWYTHRAAAPDYAVIPNLPEGGRSSLTVGIGTRVGRGLRVDAAYQYIDQADRRGRTVPLDTTVTPLVSQNNGLYTFRAHLFGATFSYAF
jgi:long-chain fatty acid transport protein